MYYCINTLILKAILKTPELNQLFSVNPGSGVPLYRQLIDQIKQSIRMDLIHPGEQLPSVRSLAAQLQINPMTISKAFAQLEIEEVLIRKRGVGMLVAKQSHKIQPSKAMNQSLKHFIETAHNEKFTDEDISTLVQQYLSINKDP